MEQSHSAAQRTVCGAVPSATLLPPHIPTQWGGGGFKQVCAVVCAAAPFSSSDNSLCSSPMHPLQLVYPLQQAVEQSQQQTFLSSSPSTRSESAPNSSVALSIPLSPDKALMSMSQWCCQILILFKMSRRTVPTQNR